MTTATLTFDDEFNSLNLWNGTTGTWQPSFTWANNGESVAGSETWWSNPGYGPTSAADANPYKVSNGVLNLEALPTPADVSSAAVGYQPYIGGLLETQNSFSQEYGYFEMNAEMPVGAGLMGAFWLLPENGSRPPELDVTEVVSNAPTTVVNTVITNDGGPDTVLNHWTDVANTTTGFHTYAVDWEPNTITWYFDGVQTFQEATPSDMHQPMYMLLDTLVGNASSWEGAPNSTTPFPASMQVNYVHAYSANPYTNGTTVVTPPATPAPVTTGSGSDTLTLAVSEDAYLGDAQFTVAVDGVQQGGTFTATALHSASVTQNFLFEGNWAPGTHTVTVDFLNDAYGGSSTLDRNLYVNSITYDGTNTNQSAELGGTGPVNFSVTDTTALPGSTTTPVTPGSGSTPALVPTGSGSDTLTLGISEDAYLGDAQFTVAVDGVQQGGTFTATALHSAGATRNFVFQGDWASGAHTVTVNFLNDAYGGSAALDRNLYVNSITYDGTNTNQSAELGGAGPLNFSVTDATPIPAAVTGSGSDTLALGISEDAYLGNAQFTVAVNGKQLGGTFTATALHSASGNQNFVFKGDFGSGAHSVTVNFLNDAYGGSAALDRNLYVNSIIYNGTNTSQSAELGGTGPVNFSVSGGTTPAVTETGDHGSLQKTLSQTGTYAVGGDTFVLGSGNADTVTLGTGVSQISFLGAGSLSLTGGSGQAVVTADAGTNTFVAGTGSLQVTGGGGSDGYVFHAKSGLLTINDFSLAKGDTLTVDKALQGSLVQASDGNGGVMLGFGTGAGDGVDIHGLAAIASSSIKWV